MVKGVYQKPKPIIMRGTYVNDPEELLEDIWFLLGVVGHVVKY